MNKSIILKLHKTIYRRKRVHDISTQYIQRLGENIICSKKLLGLNHVVGKYNRERKKINFPFLSHTFTQFQLFPPYLSRMGRDDMADVGQFSRSIGITVQVNIFTQCFSVIVLDFRFFGSFDNYRKLRRNAHLCEAMLVKTD